MFIPGSDSGSALIISDLRDIHLPRSPYIRSHLKLFLLTVTLFTGVINA